MQEKLENSNSTIFGGPLDSFALNRKVIWGWSFTEIQILN